MNASGVAQSAAGAAKAITLTAGGVVSQNIQLNAGTAFDAAAAAGAFIP